MAEGNGYSWQAVTKAQSNEKALQSWKDFLKSKGIEVRVVREGDKYVLERYGLDYFKGGYLP